MPKKEKEAVIDAGYQNEGEMTKEEFERLVKKERERENEQLRRVMKGNK